jgi:hypothetical protein
MAGTLRVRRSRGALSGFVLVLLGIWGALVPLAGPYFHFAYTTHAWSMTTGRLWLEVLPGAGAFVGGVIVLASRLRPVAMLGAWLAALSGAWFAVGTVLVPLWSHGVSAGTPAGSTVVTATERVSFFAGLGVVIVFVAALALGRLAIVAARDVALAEQRAQTAAEARTDEPAVAPVPVPAQASPARVPLRARLAKAAPGRSAPQQAAAEQAAADTAAAGQAAQDRAADTQPVRTPLRARLTKVVPGRSATPGQAAAEQAAADQAAADQATADQRAEDRITTS